MKQEKLVNKIISILLCSVMIAPWTNIQTHDFKVRALHRYLKEKQISKPERRKVLEEYAHNHKLVITICSQCDGIEQVIKTRFPENPASTGIGAWICKPCRDSLADYERRSMERILTRFPSAVRFDAKDIEKDMRLNTQFNKTPVKIRSFDMNLNELAVRIMEKQMQLRSRTKEETWKAIHDYAQDENLFVSVCCDCGKVLRVQQLKQIIKDEYCKGLTHAYCLKCMKKQLEDFDPGKELKAMDVEQFYKEKLINSYFQQSG